MQNDASGKVMVAWATVRFCLEADVVDWLLSVNSCPSPEAENGHQTALIVCVPGSLCLAPLASVTQEPEAYPVRRRLSGPSLGVFGR
ncbi:conserved protein of unknown function [Ectopseudomonas oleovorans]|uniref:Uncharacterized protein n=1 Tax=Ectopseudomonas oleovorans TaxID=301 RepID=A0A653AXL5_ECTOL|nr:conserved protein of unknown function [Pseudomonas oleovorans]